MGSEDIKARAELEELKTGISFSVEYLGYLPVAESLKKIPQKDYVTRCCILLVAQKLNLVPRLRVDDEHANCCENVSMMLGDVVVTQQNVTLNMALHDFILLDENDFILEKHPTDLISYASFAAQAFLKGFFCFVSHPSEEKGRRCMVFRTANDRVDFIHKTLNKIFNHTGQRRTVSRSRTPSVSAPPPEGYVNISDVYVIDLPVAKGLTQQPWFHGCIKREVAESKLRNEGDFLVRMSPHTKNNFALSVISNSAPAHLLLLDEEDLKVREREHSFSTVVEWIEYHLRNKLPIVADGCSLYLIQPIENDAVRDRRQGQNEGKFVFSTLKLFDELTLNTRLERLRKAIEDDGFQPCYMWNL